MINYAGNLDKRICDLVEGASNEETTIEFILSSFELLLGDIKPPTVEDLRGSSNEEIMDIIEVLDVLYGEYYAAKVWFEVITMNEKSYVEFEL